MHYINSRAMGMVLGLELVDEEQARRQQRARAARAERRARRDQERDARRATRAAPQGRRVGVLTRLTRSLHPAH